MGKMHFSFWPVFLISVFSPQQTLGMPRITHCQLQRPRIVKGKYFSWETVSNLTQKKVFASELIKFILQNIFSY